MWIKIGENIYPLESNVCVEHYSIGMEPLPMESGVRGGVVTKIKQKRLMDKVIE
jgi:hypothetical protein